MAELQYHSRQKRVLGWYAMRWAYVSSWIRGHLYRWPLPSAAPIKEPAAKEPVTNDANEQDKLEHIVEESHSILAKANTVFPFTLFQDTISIDRHKLTIIYRNFFASEQTVSIPIEDIKNIQAEHGPFFGSLIITSDNFINNTQTIHFLWNSDAIRIQKLAEGIMVAMREGIDLGAIGVRELRELLSDLGDRHKE